MAKAHAAPPSEEAPAEEVAPEAIWANGAPDKKYKKVAGYWVRDSELNFRQSTEIIVSLEPMKRVTIQPLKMSEQFDLFEILSASENPVYRNMASMGASVRALCDRPLTMTSKAVWFPETRADLKKILDDLGDDGVAAILSVREALADEAKAKPEDVAKNSVGTPA